MADIPQAGNGDPRRWIILGVLCLALAMVGIDGMIVNVALPTFVDELGASSTQLQWIVDAYTIMLASFLLFAGSTGDRLGRKRYFIVGLSIFGVGSMASALAGSPTTLILCRAVQGLGAAFIMPATLSILTNIFHDPIERAKAIALWAGVAGLGVAVGPLVGGYLLDHFWWGAIFLVNVPLALGVIGAAIVLVPESRDPDGPRLDLIGTALSTIGLVALLFGIIEGPNQGWTDPLVLVAFIGAAVLLVAFVLWERHTDHPVLDLGFFSDARFSAASVALTFLFFALFGSLFFASQYLQFVLHYSAFKCGLALLPVAVTLVISTLMSAPLARRFGNKKVVTAGMVLVAGGLWMFGFASETNGYPPIAAMLVIIGLGMGLAMAPATDSIMGSLPAAKAGVGSAMNDTTRQVGGALGVAVLGSIANVSYASHLAAHPQFATLQTASPQAAAAVESSIGAAAQVAQHLPAGAARMLDDAAAMAFINGTHDALIVGGIVAFIGAVITGIYLPARADENDRSPEADTLTASVAVPPGQ